MGITAKGSQTWRFKSIKTWFWRHIQRKYINFPPNQKLKVKKKMLHTSDLGGLPHKLHKKNVLKNWRVLTLQGLLSPTITYKFRRVVHLTSSREALPALSPIPFIVTSTCLAPANAPWYKMSSYISTNWNRPWISQ